MVPPTGTPYDVLEIEPDADEEAVERAYRRRVKETHPDHGGSIEEFQLVRTAYEQIKQGEAEVGETIEVDAEEAQRHPEQYRVEYLNYEVVDDHGWSLDDDDLFEKASLADLSHHDHGRLLVDPDESLLEAAENRGYQWPYACRGGACANCAVAVVEGDLSTPVNHVLPEEMVEKGIRLSCVGKPTSRRTKIVYNLKHLPELDDLRLPPSPFEGRYSR